MQCLHEYGLISGYKMNENKSEAMIISTVWLSHLNEQVSFNWSKQGFICLGILTPNPSRLFETNYKKLIKQIKNYLIR